MVWSPTTTTTSGLFLKQQNGICNYGFDNDTLNNNVYVKQ